MLDKKFTEAEVAEYYGTWKLQNKHTLYKVDETHVIVSGNYKKVDGDGKKEKLNLGQVASFLKDKKVINTKLFDQVDALRVLRNEQHIGAQTRVKKYTKLNMETAFSVASDVKEFARKKLV